MVPGFLFDLSFFASMGKRLTRRVLLIGWDAADWHLINPLLEAGKMPVHLAAGPLADPVELHRHR